MCLVSFTEYGDPLLSNTFNLMQDRHALLQNRGFEQPCVPTLGQEVVELFGRHFNQDFHGGNLNRDFQYSRPILNFS
jgi:hypothetical protein